MQVGDLVKLTNIHGGIYTNLRGIVTRIDDDGGTEVLWTDGDLTLEFDTDLEVVCK